MSGSQEDFTQREFPMTNGNFDEIKSIAYRLTGIKLTNHKKNMIYGRLARRMRKLNLKRFDEYCKIIQHDTSPEIVEFVNSITTNLTSFFREGHHFDFLENELFPRLIKENASSRRIRIWSAGCSTGEEPYSIAMVINSVSAIKNWDVKILATDLDSDVVMRASEGVYNLDRIESIPQKYKNNFQYEKESEFVKIKPEIRQLITFKQLNLLHRWPMKGPFDFIFCRNVVIYFDKETQKVLFERYAELLKDDGHLFIGHSESLHNVTDKFKGVGRTIYERP